VKEFDDGNYWSLVEDLDVGGIGVSSSKVRNSEIAHNFLPLNFAIATYLPWLSLRSHDLASLYMERRKKCCYLSGTAEKRPKI
jgi:hypothetical protein